MGLGMGYRWGMTPADLQTAIHQHYTSNIAFARDVGVTEQTVFNWLSGKHRIPHLVVRMLEEKG